MCCAGPSKYTSGLVCDDGVCRERLEQRRVLGFRTIEVKARSTCGRNLCVRDGCRRRAESSLGSAMALKGVRVRCKTKRTHRLLSRFPANCNAAAAANS